MNVLDRIVEFRTAKGWSEYQLAEESGMTQSTISSWYRRHMTPSIPSLERICDAFGISLSVPPVSHIPLHLWNIHPLRSHLRSSL